MFYVVKMADTLETVTEEVEKKLAVSEENPAAQVRNWVLWWFYSFSLGGKEEKEEEQEEG